MLPAGLERRSVLPLIEVHTGLDILLDTLQGAHTDGLATLFDRGDVSWPEGRLSVNLKTLTKGKQKPVSDVNGMCQLVSKASHSRPASAS
jgi:hypothetical protein